MTSIPSLTPPLPPPLSWQTRIHLSQQDGFSLWAEVYDKDPNPLAQLSERTLLEKLGHLHELRLLDLACGTAHLLPSLLARGLKACLGIDLNEQMLQIARSRQIEGIQLIQADLHALPIFAESIDVATFSLGLSYCGDLQQISQEIHRVLKPKGRLLCTDFHPSAEARGWKRSFVVNAQQYEVSHLAYSPRDILQAFERNFEWIDTQDLCFNELERTLYERSGRLQWFEEHRHQPALIYFEWEKPGHTRTCNS
ncbi:MAG: methyltransferase domain-containing protein [Terriglobia bacterium]